MAVNAENCLLIHILEGAPRVGFRPEFLIRIRVVYTPEFVFREE